MGVSGVDMPSLELTSDVKSGSVGTRMSCSSRSYREQTACCEEADCFRWVLRWVVVLFLFHFYNTRIVSKICDCVSFRC